MMRFALADLTRTAEARAAELRTLAQHANDRGVSIIVAEANAWARLAGNAREALSTQH